MYIELIFGVYPEVAAATAAGCPQKVGVLFFIRLDHVTFGINHFQTDQVIADEANGTLQRSDAPTKRDSADPDRRTVAKGGYEPLLCKRVYDSPTLLPVSTITVPFFLFSLILFISLTSITMPPLT